MQDDWSLSWLNLFHHDCNGLTEMTLCGLFPENQWDKDKLRYFHVTCIEGHCQDLQFPWYRTEFAKKNFYFSILKAWNGTPDKLVSYLTLLKITKLALIF